MSKETSELPSNASGEINLCIPCKKEFVSADALAKHLDMVHSIPSHVVGLMLTGIDGFIDALKNPISKEEHDELRMQ